MKQTRFLAARFFAAVVLTLVFTALNAACTFANTTIEGHLDSIEGHTVAGWLWDASAPETAQSATVTVTNRSTGEIVASETVEANEHRTDLMHAGYGTGDYGFHVTFNWDNLPDAYYVVSLSCGETEISRTLTHGVGDVDDIYGSSLVPLGTFKTTAYCPCYQCSEGWGRQTSSGALATANLTVAVDRRVIPIGTKLLINGQEYIAQDVGGGVKGNHIDIYYNTHGETREHGVRYAEVFVIA